MPRAARAAVDEGKRPAAVDRAMGIEQIRAGLALEDGETRLYLNQAEIQRSRHGRAGQPLVDDGAQGLKSR